MSYAQGKIDWGKVKSKIDFAIIRAGYGAGNVDKYFKYNAESCTKLGIPFGVYWFSYALEPTMAKKEAEYCINLISKYKLSYPVCFDYEDDSLRYAQNKKGYVPSADNIRQIADSFLSTIEANGYYAMLYCNKNYFKKYYEIFYGRYDMWIAQWNASEPFVSCGIWQDKATGKIDGIGNQVDTNIAYKNYPELVTKKAKAKATPEVKTYTEKEIIEYISIAKDCIKGKYGNGNTRKKKIKDMGYDYPLLQEIIGLIMHE